MIIQNFTLVKKCGRCKNEKCVSEFYAHKQKKYFVEGICKACTKEAARRYYYENKEYVKEKVKISYYNNREYKIRKQKEWVHNNYEWVKQRSLIWRKNNKEKIEKWRRDNKHHRNEYIKEYCKARKKSDPDFKLQCQLRSMLHRVLKRTDQRKESSTEELLGYNQEDLRKRIECQFQPGMSWDKMGLEIHIDHKIPIDHFVNKGETRPYIINSLANLQPLWKSDNYSKSNKHPLDLKDDNSVEEDCHV